MFEQRQSAAAHVNLIFSGFVTKNTPFLQDVVYPEDAFIKIKKKHGAGRFSVDRDSAHLYAEAPRTKNTQSCFVFLFFFQAGSLVGT